MTQPAGWPLRPKINLAATWREYWTSMADEIATSPAGAMAAEQGFVLTTAQLAGVFGWSAGDLRRERRRGRWWSPVRGTASPVVIGGDDHTSRRRRHALTAVAAALTHPGQVISGRSAAIVYGLPTMSVPDEPELTARTEVTYGRHGSARSYRAAIVDPDLTTWFGVELTSPARTVVDLGRHDRFDGIMAADAALRDELTVRSELIRPLSAGTGWPGIRRARAIVDLASPLAESPLESVTRLRLVDDRFPNVGEQQPFRDPRTGQVDWVDFLIDRRLILEADGKEKYVDDALWREKQREVRLRRHPVLLDRVIWEDVTRYWHRTADRLWSLLRAR